MAIHNVTDSALLVNKSRKTIQRYIANRKLTVTRDELGNPQIDTTELLRVFGKLSQVSQKKILKKSQDVAPDLSHQIDTDISKQITRAIIEAQKPLLDEIAKLSKQVENLTNRLEYKPAKVAARNKRIDESLVDIKELLHVEPTKVESENIRTTKHSAYSTKEPEFLKPDTTPKNYLDDMPVFGKR